MRGLLGRMLGRKSQREQALEIVETLVRRVAEGAATFEQVRERLAHAARAGDLDDVVTKLVGTQRAAELYVKTGQVP